MIDKTIGALRELLTAVEPFRAFRGESDSLVDKVAIMDARPGDGGPQLARLERAFRRAFKVAQNV